MKQIDESDYVHQSKYFLTPKRNNKCPIKQLQQKIQEEKLLVVQNQMKFDLTQSPIFNKGNEQIKSINSSYQKKIISSQRKPYSPIIIKKEQEMPSTQRKEFQIKMESDNLEYLNLRDQKIFKTFYKSIIDKIKAQKSFHLLNPSIIQCENIYDQYQYSQLVTYQLNPKNSRCLTYDQDKLTLVSIYQCLGCTANYKSPAALGGHMRSCPEKERHYSLLSQYYRSCEIQNQKLQKQKISQNNKGKKKNNQQLDKVKKSQMIQQRNQIYVNNTLVFFSSQSNNSGNSPNHDEKKQNIAQKSNESNDLKIQSQDEAVERTFPPKTLKKIYRKAFIPNKKRGRNRQLFPEQ